MAFTCSCTQGTSSYYTLIGRGTTAEFDCTSATRVLVIRSYTDARAGRIIYSPEFSSLIFIYFSTTTNRLIDSTDCDKSRLRQHRKHIYIDIYWTCDTTSLHNIESIGLETVFYLLYGNRRDHTLVMDLTSLYSKLIMLKSWGGSVAVACGARLSCSVFMMYSLLLSMALVARAPI